MSAPSAPRCPRCHDELVLGAQGELNPWRLSRRGARHHGLRRTMQRIGDPLF